MAKVIAYGDDCIRLGHNCNATNMKFAKVKYGFIVDVHFLIFQIKSVAIDKQFLSNYCQNGHDWAIIEVETPFELNENVSPTCLPHKNHRIEDIVTAVGWGRSNGKSKVDIMIYQL